MPRPRSGSVRLTKKFLESITKKEIEDMDKEKRAAVVQRLSEEGIKISSKIYIALQGGFRSLEDVMSLSGAVDLPSSGTHHNPDDQHRWEMSRFE